MDKMNICIDILKLKDHLYDFYLLDLAPAPPNFFGSHLLGSATNKVLSYCKSASLISLFDCSSTNF